MWQGIREIINIKSKHDDIPTRISSNNSIIYFPKEISNKFNDYFSNIVNDILNGRKYEGHKKDYGDFMFYMSVSEPDSIPLHTVTNEDIFDIICNLITTIVQKV